MSQSVSPLLAHTGHEHSRGSQPPQPDPAQAEPFTSAPGSSSDSAMDGATGNPANEAMASPQPGPDQQTGVPEQNSAAVEAPQQPVETITQPDAVAQTSTEPDQAALIGNLGGEFLLLLIVAGPFVLRQLRRWI